MMETKEGPEILILKFADSKIPVFRETRNKDYILYGEKNNYPEYLTYLADKSGDHNAILVGKAHYIFGGGFEGGNFTINRLGESLNDISRKSILDIVIYGGFRWEIVWNVKGQVSEIYHVDYSTLRTGKTTGFYYKEAWSRKNSDGSAWVECNRDEEEFIPTFDPSKPFGTQIYAYNEYRPMTRFYPLPDYIGCNNYIETDIEISKFHLSAIRNGMLPSKMLQFYDGDPGEEKKRALEASFKRKFGGAENAGNIVMVFNKNKDKSIDVQDLSASDLDKQFDLLTKTCQQKIFSGHGVTSPMLFGIQEPGKLGGSTELNIAHSIFQNTYSTPKAETFSKEVQYVLGFSQYRGVYELEPVDPIGIQLDIKDFTDSLPKSYVFKKFDIPEELWNLETIGVTNKPTPTVPIVPSTEISPIAPGGMINENLKHLNARQLQNMERIIRKYKKGQISEPMARHLLSSGYGLTDEDVGKFLGIIRSQLSASSEESEDIIIGMFDACGEDKNDYQVIRSKPVSFSQEEEMEQDELVYRESFKTDLTASEAKIIDLIKKDRLITSSVIAVTIGQTVAYVESKITNLTQRGYIEEHITTSGIDNVVERVILPDLEVPPTTIDKTPISKITVMYSYEVKPGVGPELIPTSRPFCIRMIQLARLYTRADIEKISSRLGYSVFDRKGGWWGKSPECRHLWKSNIVVKKGGNTK